jgi:large subunit ribosomal protein L35
VRSAPRRGRVLRGVDDAKAYKNHILTKKTTKRKRKLDTPTHVSTADQDRVERMLPYGGK